MMKEAHVSIRLALLQVLAVFIGVIMTRAAFWGEDYMMEVVEVKGNALALLIRHHGYLLLAVPLVWTCAVVWLENRPGGGWGRRWTVGTGLFLLAALTFLLYWTCTHPYGGQSAWY